MSKVVVRSPVAGECAAVSGPAGTVVSHHVGEDDMGSRSLTVGRYGEIQRRLLEGCTMREIARALGCARATVREVRDGERGSPDAPKAMLDQLWMLQ